MHNADSTENLLIHSKYDNLVEVLHYSSSKEANTEHPEFKKQFMEAFFFAALARYMLIAHFTQSWEENQ